MALILTRTNQRARFVHDDDPAVDQTIGTIAGQGWRTAEGQPADCTVFEISPVSSDAVGRWRATGEDRAAGQQILFAAAGVTIDGKPAAAADVPHGYGLAVEDLIFLVSQGPLASRLPKSTTAAVPVQSEDSPA